MSDHCCYLQGEVCIYLEENTEEGFRWSCGLRRTLGNWDAVLADPRYKEWVEPRLSPGINCRDYPETPDACRQCYGA